MFDERDGVHEGDINFDSLRYQIFDFTEHRQVIFGLDIFRVCRIQASDETSQGCDADTFTDTKHS